MKKILYIFTFLLFVVPASKAFACEISSTQPETEQSSCDEEMHSKSCCDAHNIDDKDCSGSCGNSSCHCPVTINSTIAVSKYEVTLSPNLSFIKTSWTYLQNAPKSGYLTFWQLPKIS